MSLICMAVYSTEENGKDEYLKRTLDSLKYTVDFSKHRLILSVNACTLETLDIMLKYNDIISHVIKNDTNIGTAEAVNKGWKTRKPNENAVKMDDDVVIYASKWMDLMDDICNSNKWIGQVGLKRKDLEERPDHPNPFYKSSIKTAKIKGGTIEVEQCQHIMGTCVMHSARLLNKVGYLYQPTIYGFDDSLMSYRSNLEGLKTVFIPSISIDHIDPGNTEWTKWKNDHAGEAMQLYNEAIYRFKSNRYYEPR